MKEIIIILGLFLFSGVHSFSQVPTNVLVQILKAEDARRHDETLEKLLKHSHPDVRTRAALAAGRIGDQSAIPALRPLLEKGIASEREMAAFALGEIESIEAADAILRQLNEQMAETRPIASVPGFKGRLVEAAGKIAAANPKEERSKELGKAIIDLLEAENKRGTAQDRETVLLALTASLRTRSDGSDVTIAKFLTNPDARVRADAANALARLRSKNANETLREMLRLDADPIARANAARALGAAEDKDAVEHLIKAATGDRDGRVRVSAIRSLATIRDPNAAEPLIARGEDLIGEYTASAFRRAKAQSELLEIFVTLGRLIPNSRNERAVNLIREFAKRDNGHSPEAYIARIRIAPGRGDDKKNELTHWRQYSTLAQVVGEFAALEPTADEAKKMKGEAPNILRPLVEAYTGELSAEDKKTVMAAPDVLRAYARFKPEDLPELLHEYLNVEDVFMRATAAELLAEQPPSRGTVAALEKAFMKALQTDKRDNDAQLAMLDAMAKIDRAAAVDTLYLALDAPDYLVRKRAFDLLEDVELIKKYPGAVAVVRNARLQDKHRVLRYDLKTGTKLGQVLNTDADYRRAVSRKNGTVRAVLTTEKGNFTIDLLPEDAPLTVDNFIKLARSGYFNGLEVHRVVPNFVMQDGDPRGDGNGGPGWSIRCEINMIPYDRGAVGMALSGKDTGGSQWFVTHSPQPHLDGGYTVFGRVNETGMKVVDSIVRGDKVVNVRIVERTSPQRRRVAEKKR